MENSRLSVRSSVGSEHYTDNVGVGGSNPPEPTKQLVNYISHKFAYTWVQTTLLGIGSGIFSLIILLNA